MRDLGRVLRVVAVALVGAVVVWGGIFYFAWAASWVQPIDWRAVTSAALIFGPFGLLVGMFAWDR